MPTLPINSAVSNSSDFLPNFAVDTGATLTVGDSADVFIGTLGNGPSGGGTVVIGPTGAAAYLSITPATSTTFSGSFSGLGSLELSNTSTTLTLTGASNGGNIGTIGGDLTLCNCFGGGLTIDGGALTVNGLGQGVFVNGGTLSVVNGGTLQDNADLLRGERHGGLRPGLVGHGGRRDRSRHLRGRQRSPSATAAGSTARAAPRSMGSSIPPSVTVTGTGSTWTVGAAGLLGRRRHHRRRRRCSPSPMAAR